ncbi:MAG: hypothetical protein JSW58_15885 [Candidatus Latescibacterota bacterium]|nr:MAG: hypothetical protein JSW58_15885 [Candidatus Latescibacterota bacterium]
MAVPKTVVQKTAFLVGIALTLSLIVVFGCTKSVDVLRDGGFETQAPDQAGPVGWSVTRVPHTKDFVAFAWDDRVSHTGTRSVSISIDESHPDDQIDYNWNRAVPECRPGKTYEVTGWVKAHNLKSTAFIVVQCWDNAFSKMLSFATTQQEFQITGTTDWVQVKITIGIPVETRRVMILAGIRAPDNRGGKVWFDDFQIAPVADNP